MVNDTTQPLLKRCIKCGEQKPANAEHFPKRQSKDGLNNECKQCKSKYLSEYRQRNHDKLLILSREYWQTNHETLNQKRREYNPENKEKIARRNQSYYQRNREKVNERCREYYKHNKFDITCRIREYRAANRDENNRKRRMYYANNREICIQYQHEYRKSNQEIISARMRAYRQRNWHIIASARNNRRTRIRSLPSTFTGQHWLSCLEYWHYSCAVCGAQLRDLFGNIEPHADHWIPVKSCVCPGTVPGNMICLCNTCNQSKWAKPPEPWLIKRYGKQKANTILKRINDYFDWARRTYETTGCILHD